MQVPHYLPDPRDGSIYQLSQMGSLKKLPYTIPQLVANAPCRSSDGILYSGKKSDTWYMVDPKTGRREKVMGFGEANMEGKDSDQIGWATSRAIYLGRTQYTVMMFDSQAKDKNAKPWNITFYDYNALSAPPELAKEYGNEIHTLLTYLIWLKLALALSLRIHSSDHHKQWADCHSGSQARKIFVATRSEESCCGCISAGP